MWFYINRDGKLGNRLFSRAHVYAAAIEYGEIVVDWGAKDISHLFPNLGKTTMPMFIPPALDVGEPFEKMPIYAAPRVLSALHKACPRMTGTIGPLWMQHWGTGDPERMRLDTKYFAEHNRSYRNVILNGFKLRCPSWVVKNREIICKHFLPPEVIREKWMLLRECWRREFSFILGIHMRQTDFRSAAGGRNYMTTEEYVSVANKISGIDPGSTLVIFFSDENYFDNDTYRSSLGRRGASHRFVNNGMAIDDLAGMMACDGIVGPVSSTFSRWAAFAGDRKWLGLSRSMLEGYPESFELSDPPVPWGYV